MQLVQPERNRLAIPPERQLERVVDPPIVVLVVLVRSLRLRRRRRRCRLSGFPRLELLNLDRPLAIRQRRASFRVGEGVGEDGGERARGADERGDEGFFEGEGAVLLVSEEGEGGGGGGGGRGGGGGGEPGGGFEMLLGR